MPDERREARERAQSLESWSRRSWRRAIHNLGVLYVDGCCRVAKPGIEGGGAHGRRRRGPAAAASHRAVDGSHHVLQDALIPPLARGPYRAQRLGYQHQRDLAVPARVHGQSKRREEPPIHQVRRGAREEVLEADSASLRVIFVKQEHGAADRTVASQLVRQRLAGRARKRVLIEVHQEADVEPTELPSENEIPRMLAIVDGLVDLGGGGRRARVVGRGVESDRPVQLHVPTVGAGGEDTLGDELHGEALKLSDPVPRDGCPPAEDVVPISGGALGDGLGQREAALGWVVLVYQEQWLGERGGRPELAQAVARLEVALGQEQQHHSGLGHVPGKDREFGRIEEEFSKAAIIEGRGYTRIFQKEGVGYQNRRAGRASPLQRSDVDEVIHVQKYIHAREDELQLPLDNSNLRYGGGGVVRVGGDALARDRNPSRCFRWSKS
eukprot:scaffold6193_cov123-Isochrysis_galbana.AAC.5